MVLASSFDTPFFSSRREHTRFDCDWSSDVCSSDLIRVKHDHRAPLCRSKTFLQSAALAQAGFEFQNPHAVAKGVFSCELAHNVRRRVLAVANNYHLKTFLAAFQKRRDARERGCYSLFIVVRRNYY